MSHLRSSHLPSARLPSARLLSSRLLRWLVPATCAAVAFAAAPAPAAAHGLHGSVHFHVGGPWRPWRPLAPGLHLHGYWGPPVWVAPVQPVVVVRDPPVYIERDPAEESAPAPSAAPSAVDPTVWWYWCPAAQRYYPYVKQCAGGFQRVPPQPVPER